MKRHVNKVGELSEVVLEKNNDVPKHNRKYPGFRNNFKEYVQEFTDYTGIHGFKYMGEKDRSIFERLWWLVLFCISLWFCISLIIDTWRKWNAAPVLVSFARSPTPVWEIPFPAITICPETKARQSVYNFTDAYDRYMHGGNMTEEEMKRFSDSGLLCDNNVYSDGNKTTGSETIDYLLSVAPQMGSVLFSCKWTLLNESCFDLFTPVITEEGQCFTFNMLSKKELLRDGVLLHKGYMIHNRVTEGWTLEGGYNKYARMDTFPRRALSAGATAGLFLVLASYQQDLDYLCRGPVQGYKIILHHPAEIPRVGRNYFRAPLNQEVVVSITPDMITTSPELKQYDPHRRQCYFQNEKYLSLFRNYTQQNCELECLTNYTLTKCGCVEYHMPHNETTPLCAPASLSCTFEAQFDLLEKDDASGDYFICDCLPACTSLAYDSESTQADFRWQKIFEGYRANVSEFPGIQLSRLTLFFKQQEFITSERNELYGISDFFANCGGILGLFTGFSFLSSVEILYFLSLRLICNAKKYGRHYWSGSSRLVQDNSYVHG